MELITMIRRIAYKVVADFGKGNKFVKKNVKNKDSEGDPCGFR